jgi:hypothetical protein
MRKSAVGVCRHSTPGLRVCFREEDLNNSDQAATSGNTADVVSATIQGETVRYRQMAVRFFATMLWTWVGASNAVATDLGSPGLEQVEGDFMIIAQASNLFGGDGKTVMAIDIKPGDTENIVEASSGRVIPVAIFGSSDLNVTAINPRTIKLNGVDVMLVGKSDKSLCQQTDINDDGHEDLLCDVRTTGFKVSAGEYKVILKAATYKGVSLRGEDRIRIVQN